MHNYYAFVLAAGAGSRMSTSIPKQYLPLLDKPVIFHTIDVLYRQPEIKRIFVLLSPNDDHFDSYDWKEFDSKLMPIYCGGATRAETVLGGLKFIRDVVSDTDWILVHDAVRPCLDTESLSRLILEVTDDDVGGLLAVPVVDTLKKSKDGRAITTQSRNELWRAQTPQMYRYKLLYNSHIAVDPLSVTDEAGTIELLGLSSKLVTGSEYNIKITYPDDLTVAKNNLLKVK